MKQIKKYAYILIIAIVLPIISNAQFSINPDINDINYSSPKEYEIGGITVSGTHSFDVQSVIALSGLAVGKKISVPGAKISNAIKSLWKQKLFADIKIAATKIEGEKIFLNIRLKESPRMSRYKITGVKKGQESDIREEIDLIRGKIVTKNLITNTKNTVRNFFVKKGFLNTTVEVVQKSDSTLLNSVILIIDVVVGNRTKIADITFLGNTSIKSRKLRGSLKDTKRKRWYNVFTTSKYIPHTYQKDKASIIAKYNEKGFRDAKIEKDTVFSIDTKLVAINITVSEGNPYYFRNIKWVGNSIYTSGKLDSLLGIKKGDRYNKSTLDSRLFMSQTGTDVSSFYLDKGYLFFNLSPVEVKIENDSIDLEMRIYEGKQAIINKIIITGNTKTQDHVIRREIRTRPGQLFSRSDIIRTQRELAQLGYFNPETLSVNPSPNQEDGTVDIEYVVEEKPSDQIELSAGWGGRRIIGTLGVSFSNFSTRNFFKKGSWRPLPAGDGQKLGLRAQSSGTGFQSYSFSFTEPWLGGKKPNSLSFSASHSIQSVGSGDTEQSIKIYGLSLGLGKRVKWPDDFFSLYTELSYQYYVLTRFSSRFAFSDGFSNNLSFKAIIERNSISSPIYPRSGSKTTLTFKATAPYSLIFPVEDYSVLSAQEKYLFAEYHKWKFQTWWYSSLVGNLVLHTKAGFGFLGTYNKNLGLAPFERFYLGGDGLSGFSIDGREVIALRGYPTESVSPRTGASIATKYTMELRYPLSLNPTATIFGLVFAEAGNSWGSFKEFNPFEVNKSAGVGVRIFMPMFGMLGLDWAYRFDDIPGRTDPSSRSEVHFSIGGNINGW